MDLWFNWRKIAHYGDPQRAKKYLRMNLARPTNLRLPKCHAKLKLNQDLDLKLKTTNFVNDDYIIDLFATEMSLR